MSNQVEKFDPSTLMQGVKDRIKSTFVSLIPDDRWDEMVKREVDAFLTPQPNLKISINQDRNSNWNSYKWTIDVEGEVSPFRQMVWEQVMQKAKEVINKAIVDDYFTSAYSENELLAKDKLKELIAEAAPLALTKFISHLMFNAANDIRQQLQNYR